MTKSEEILLLTENIIKKQRNKILVTVRYPIYYINLDKDTERKQQTEKNLQNIALNYTRISGLYGKNIKNKMSDTLDNIEFKNDYYKSMNKSEIGCMLSHIKAIHTAYKNGDNIALITEDDINTDIYSFSKSLEEIVSVAPKNWEILQLFCGDLNILKYLGESESLKFMKYKPTYWSCTAYLINRSGMEKIINTLEYPYHIKKISKNFPSNGVSDCWLYSICNTYTIYPYPFIPNTFIDSTIHNSHIELVHVPAVYNFLYKLNNYITEKNKLIYVDKKSDIKFVSRIFPDNFLTGEKSKASVLVYNAQSNNNIIYKYPKIIIDYGSSDDTGLKADLVITTKKYPKHNIPFIYVPRYSISFAEYDLSPEILLEKKSFQKNKFCILTYTNNLKNIYKEFYRMLQKKSDNRVDIVKKSGDEFKNTGNLTDYKFMLCFENEDIEGYITEKIIFAMINGCIPIYFGSSDINDHFNPNSFINIKNYNDINGCIEHIIHLDQNVEEYNKMLIQPWLINNTLTGHFSWWNKNLGNFYEKLNYIQTF